jgi:hypothetical protein
MKKYLLIFVCLLTSLYTQAQTTDSTKTKIYRNHIGINTQFAQDQFFNPNARTPLQLMYKRQNKKNTGAWRLGMEIYYNYSDSVWSANRFSGGVHWLRTGLSVGYEWQKEVAPKFMLFYGADIQSQVYYVKSVGRFTSSVNIPGFAPDEYGFEETTRLDFILKSFVGIRYNFSKRFYIAYELNMQIRHHRYSNTLRSYAPRTATLRDFEFTNTQFALQPYSGVYCFLLF